MCAEQHIHLTAAAAAAAAALPLVTAPHLCQVLVYDRHQAPQQQHVHCDALADAWPLHLDRHQLPSLTQHALVHLQAGPGAAARRSAAGTVRAVSVIDSVCLTTCGAHGWMAAPWHVSRTNLADLPPFANKQCCHTHAPAAPAAAAAVLFSAVPPAAAPPPPPPPPLVPTWPRLAAATGCSLSCSYTLATGTPSSSSTTAHAISLGKEGSRSCSSLSVSRYTCGDGVGE